MGISKKAADAYTLFKMGKKVLTYGKLVKAAIDEDTRPGALAKLGIRGMLEIAGKAIGTSLTSHPYFRYHKAHLEALAQALNASSNFDSAQAALNGAIRSADASESLAKTLGIYAFRKNGLKLVYVTMIGGSLRLLADSGPQAEKQLKDANQTRDSLRTTVDQSMYEWRASFCDLVVDSVQLLAMAQVELRTAQLAMKRFNDKIKALKSASSIGVVFAYKAEENWQWQEFDRMTQPGTGDSRAVADPSGYARDRVDAIENASDQLAKGCDAALSDDAYNPDRLILRIGTL
jgi:hypothetical protein